jgi:hypothetical protein
MKNDTARMNSSEHAAEQLSERLCQITREIFEEDRALLSLIAAQALLEHCGGGAEPAVTARDATKGGDEWVKITSLSQLRALVGGRFQQLKDRWVAAGFPLREHRGDRSKGATVDEAAWLDLAVWISRQGFEARRDASLSDELFAVRPVTS